MDREIDPIDLEVLEPADRARGPADRQPGDLPGRPQSDQDPRIVRGLQATASLALAVEGTHLWFNERRGGREDR